MRAKFRCVCCGRTVSKYANETRADAGFLCQVCGFAYRMGMQDTLRAKRNDIGKKVCDDLEDLRDRLIRYQDEVAFLTKFLYCSDENFKEKWDERLKKRDA